MFKNIILKKKNRPGGFPILAYGGEAPPERVTFFRYSYYEEGCWIKCTRQPRNVSWVVLSSLFFNEI